MPKTRIATIVLLGVALAVTITARLVWATPGTSHPTLLGRGTFDELKVKRNSPALDVEVKAKTSFDVATQMITFEPGQHSGWHSHPGPVFITVLSGTMTFYDSDDPACSPVVVTAGQGLGVGFLDVGEHAHIARNESGATAINIVTYFAPVGVPLRIDQPQPSNCPVFQ